MKPEHIYLAVCLALLLALFAAAVAGYASLPDDRAVAVETHND